eukprot:scaffold73910_cov36-Tisochrysis_lutea.AAC.1
MRQRQWPGMLNVATPLCHPQKNVVCGSHRPSVAASESRQKRTASFYFTGATNYSIIPIQISHQHTSS